MMIIIIVKSKSMSFGLALVRQQAFLEGRQVWCIYCFIGQAVPLSYHYIFDSRKCYILRFHAVFYVM